MNAAWKDPAGWARNTGMCNDFGFPIVEDREGRGGKKRGLIVTNWAEGTALRSRGEGIKVFLLGMKPADAED